MTLLSDIVHNTYRLQKRYILRTVSQVENSPLHKRTYWVLFFKTVRIVYMSNGCAWRLQVPLLTVPRAQKYHVISGQRVVYTQKCFRPSRPRTTKLCENTIIFFTNFQDVQHEETALDCSFSYINSMHDPIQFLYRTCVQRGKCNSVRKFCCSF